MKYKKTRFCPSCGKELFYSCNSSYNLCKRTEAKCRSCATFLYAKSKGNCKRLLEGSLESYYWIGFILADGHIHNKRRLVVNLSVKDEQHLKNLAFFLNIPKLTYSKKGSGEVCKIAVMDTYFLNILSEKFDINSNKTKMPPNLSVFDSLSEKELLAIFTGFIDGDGHIKKRKNLSSFSMTIKNHKNWFDFLNYFNNKILKDKGKNKINSQGYSNLTVTDTTVLKNLKEKVMELNLPIMLRKWDNINLEFMSKYQLATIRKDKIVNYLKQGLKNKEIAEKLGMCQSAVSSSIKRNNLYKNI